MDNPFSSAAATPDNSQAVEQSGPVPQASGLSSLPADASPGKKKTSPEQRARYRYKYYRARGMSDVDAAKKAGLGAVPEISEPASEVSSVSPQGSPLPVVLHNPAAFKPLVTMLATAGEKASVGRLVRTARKIDAALADKVAQDAPWNPLAKETVLELGPSVCARYAAKIGLPADSAEDIAFISAIGMIVSGHITLANELAEIAAKLDKNKTEAKP